MSEILQDFERTAAIVARTGLDEASWTDLLRGQVVDLLHRGSRVLAAIDGSGSEHLATIRWSRTDSTVMLARGLARVHRRLVAFDAQATQPAFAAAA
jgi:hypothetical protein